MHKYSNSSGGGQEVCSCGKHKGQGTSSPHELAMIYNWFKQRGKPDYNDYQRGYLESYEAMHGKLAEDEFIFNTGRFANDSQVQACRNGGALSWK